MVEKQIVLYDHAERSVQAAGKPGVLPDITCGKRRVFTVSGERQNERIFWNLFPLLQPCRMDTRGQGLCTEVRLMGFKL